MMNVLEKILEEIENLNYYPDGMGCGIEDCGITDRYEACEYGWNEAIEAVIEAINNMRETISEIGTVEKEKVTSAEIISREIDGKPYYEIKFKKVGEDEYNIGYSSFKLDYVIKWLNDYFEFCGETKVSCENGGWIPVEERLPEEGTEVLCCFENGTVQSLWQNWKNDGLGNYLDDDLMPTEVIAWQPLPKPYKPKKDISAAGTEHVMSRFMKVEVKQ